MINNIDFSLDIKHLCENIYSLEDRQINQDLFKNYDDIDSAINFLKDNRLIHYFAIKFKEKYKRNVKIIYSIQEYELYKRNLRMNLEIICSLIKDSPFIVIKTISSYPHTTSDLDILVKEKSLASYIKNRMAHFKYISDLPIDVSDNICWGGVVPIHNDFIWSNVKEINIDGIFIKIPNSYLDTLIRIAHIPFELSVIRLGELLHIYKISKDLDWEILEKEAELMGWLKTFKRMKYILEELHYALFAINFFKDTPLIMKRKIYNFPYYLSFNFLLKAVLEKRAWRKILGARYIIKDRLQLCLRKNFL